MQFLGFTGILEQDGAWGQTQGIGESKVPGGQGCHRKLKRSFGFPIPAVFWEMLQKTFEGFIPLQGKSILAASLLMKGKAHKAS